MQRGRRSRRKHTWFRFLLRLVAAWLLLTTATVLALRWIDPPTSAVMLAWEVRHMRRAEHEWQALAAISPQLQIAVIAAEDQKFPQHFGFDVEQIRRALDEKRARPRGASTISQQVAKNLFLWSGRSYLRKGLEAGLTVLIEVFWPKQRILEVYFNIAEFGDGVYGAEAAAQRFFGRPASDLDSRQAALLAAVLPSPKVMSAARPSAYVTSRAATIRRMVQQLGGTGYLRRLQ